MPEQQKKQTGRCFKIFMRIMNAVTALVLIGFGIAGIIIFSVKQLLAFKFFLACSPLFMILFGLMLLAADFNFKLVKKYFLFLHSFLGRGFFNIYLSTAVFFYFSCGNESDVLAWVAASIIFVLGLIYCFMHCICGNKAEQEDDKNSSKSQRKEFKEQMI